MASTPLHGRPSFDECRPEYDEPLAGRVAGRDAIIKGFAQGAESIPGWQFPSTWVVIEGNRAVYGWDTVLPEGRTAATRLSRVATFVYAGNGRFCQHVDVYDSRRLLELVREASAIKADAVFRGVGGVGGPHWHAGPRSVARFRGAS